MIMNMLVWFLYETSLYYTFTKNQFHCIVYSMQSYNLEMKRSFKNIQKICHVTINYTALYLRLKIYSIGSIVWHNTKTYNCELLSQLAVPVICSTAHLRGGIVLQLKVTLQQQVSALGHRTTWHWTCEVQFAVYLNKSLHIVIFRFLQMAHIIEGQRVKYAFLVDFPNIQQQMYLILAMPYL